MRSFFATVLTLSAVVASAAKQIVITVGGNTTANESAVFQPAEVTAKIGDVLFFNFTKGNHSAIQSDFATPCIPIHDTNITINGFNSGIRDAGNGTSITNLAVTVTDNSTIWFYDINTCAEAGVGGVNINDSSTATLDGFRRNAIRLNGTSTTTSESSSHSATATGAASSSTASDSSKTTSGAERAMSLGFGAAMPMAVVAFLL